ncbi:MAG: hypothetical protein H6Q15_897 [Bacteroidetes bacterium]|nr:hypothetical protein [Bacteroidota bacterium]
MGRKIISVLIPLIILLSILWLGRLIYLKEWFYKCSVDDKVVPLDVVNLIVTSICTFFIAWFISKKITSSRYKVDFLIEDLKNVNIELIRLQEKVIELNNIELHVVLSSLNRIRSNYSRFEKTLELAKIRCSESKAFNPHYTRLYNITTGVKSNKLELDDANRIIVENSISSLIELIRQIIFKINDK